ncbi:MAG TPA: hypothetical protein VMX18_04500 [Candidatus Bipolaricaulota bacterium]|nr:hypothetical protein [Candidatus Bipolaricaulota bacterium]
MIDKKSYNQEEKKDKGKEAVESADKSGRFSRKEKKQSKKRHGFSFFSKPSKAIESIASIYKQTDELFKNNAPIDGEVKEEEQILAQIMEKRKIRRKRMIIFSALCGLAIIAGASVFGFFVFNKRQQFSEDKINIEILGPSEAIIGQEISYLINYENKGNIDIDDVNVFIKLPQGFDLIEKIPETDGTNWHFDKLKVGESGQIKLTGKLIDRADSEQKMAVTLSYQPENFSSEFSTGENFYTQLLPAEIDTEVSSPETAAPGQKINLVISYQNNSENDYDKFILKLSAPADFQMLSSQPQATNNEWLIENIGAESDKQEISVEGKFGEDLNLAEVEIEQKFSLQVLYPGKLDNKFLQKEEGFSIRLSDEEIFTYLIINGKTENSNTCFGNDLTGSIIFKNTGDKSFENLTAKLIIEQSPVDVLDWQNSNFAGGVKANIENGKEIKWSLSGLQANSEKVIDFKIPVAKLSALSDFSNDSLSAQKLKFHSTLSFPDEARTIDSSALEIGLNSDLKLGIKALYYDAEGNALGSGPLPPQANKKTEYVIYWDISNNLHEITDIKVKTKLAEKVSWVGEQKIGVGQMNFNADTGEVVWEINRLPKNINESHANFRIGLRPLSEDISKLMKLTETTTIEAKDAVTGETIVMSLNPITSNLEFDDKGKEKGVVIQEIE